MMRHNAGAAGLEMLGGFACVKDALQKKKVWKIQKEKEINHSQDAKSRCSPVFNGSQCCERLQG